MPTTRQLCETCKVIVQLRQKHLSSQSHVQISAGKLRFRCQACENTNDVVKATISRHRTICKATIYEGEELRCEELTDALAKSEKEILAEAVTDEKELRGFLRPWKDAEPEKEEKSPTFTEEELDALQEDSDPKILLAALKFTRKRHAEETAINPKRRKSDEPKFGVYARLKPGEPLKDVDFGMGGQNREKDHETNDKRYGTEKRAFVWIIQPSLKQEEAFNGEHTCISLQDLSKVHNERRGSQFQPYERLPSGDYSMVTCKRMRKLWATLFVAALRKAGLMKE